MAGWNLYQLLEPMGEEYYMLFRRRLAQYSDSICSKKENRTAAFLLNMLWQENIICSVTKRQLSSIISELFMDQFKDSKWMLRYLEEMIAYIPDTQEKMWLVENGRTERYYKYLQKTSERLKAEAQKTKDYAFAPELRDTVIDCVKFIIAVNAVNERGAMSKSARDDLSLEICGNEVSLLLREMMGTLDEDAAENTAEFEKKPDKQKGGLFAGIKIAPPKKPKHTLRSREKVLATLLTWLLYYRICEQDGIPAEEAEA